MKQLGLSELKKRPIFNSKYHLIATIGKSVDSKVYLAQEIQKPSNRSAFKIMQKEDTLWYSEHLRKLEHKNIVKVLEYGQKGFI